MPTKSTTRKARRDMAEGKSPSTAAGEFVREEMEEEKKGRGAARSPRQAIAIGLSKARRAGVPLKPPPAKRGRTSGRRGARAQEPRAQKRGPSRGAAAPRGRTSKRGAATGSNKGGKTRSTRTKRAGSTRRQRAS